MPRSTEGHHSPRGLGEQGPRARGRGRQVPGPGERGGDRGRTLRGEAFQKRELGPQGAGCPGDPMTRPGPGSAARRSIKLAAARGSIKLIKTIGFYSENGHTRDIVNHEKINNVRKTLGF